MQISLKSEVWQIRGKISFKKWKLYSAQPVHLCDICEVWGWQRKLLFPLGGLQPRIGDLTRAKHWARILPPKYPHKSNFHNNVTPSARWPSKDWSSVTEYRGRLCVSPGLLLIRSHKAATQYAPNISGFRWYCHTSTHRKRSSLLSQRIKHPAKPSCHRSR